ncbi:Retrovirus-related Pol polyprotein [Ceratobasidium theobromae]|uniref:Retrovirus-related Pol polyprotein n=1 Tax=Ceratobasidium theobromae TaxID=1582974 RepID=A0A5N5Q831_9AGAM|nr:Retrovirus-related Pol polyprotein [Ceratobasidium theobromae]
MGPPGGPGPPGGGRGSPGGQPPQGVQPGRPNAARPFRPQPVHFDTKLKPEIIPEWDGRMSELGDWMIKINDIAAYSEFTSIQLGQQVPLRFKGRAANWFGALDFNYRRQITANWETLKLAMVIHFMDRHYLETQKAKALEAKYRQRGHEHETPEDYVIRKAKELTSFTDWTDMELMLEVMNGAPESWHVLVNPQRIPDWNTFLDEISWNQQQLMKLGHDLGGKGTSSDIQRQLDRMQSTIHRLENSQRKSSRAAVRSHQVSSKPVGWNKNLPKAPHPRRDDIVSKGKTPKDKGARGCIHCSSLNHWDKDCAYHVKKSGRKFVRTNLVETEDLDLIAAQEAYEDLCYESEEDDLINLESESEPSESEEDFHEPLKSMTVAASSEKPITEAEEPQVSLGGNANQQEATAVTVHLTKSSLVEFSFPKMPTRRSLTKKLKLAKVRSQAVKIGEEITLKWLMSRPAGTAFYGCKASIIKGWIQNQEGPKRRITFDTGSEITLINEELIGNLNPPPRIKLGQKLQLVQVTGNSTICRYVTLPLIFDTDQGIVKMNVEAYVVPKMNTPFILGTDFASQYQLSLIRNEDGTHIQFGSSGRTISVEESDSTPRIDNSGNTFLVEVSEAHILNQEKKREVKKAYQERKRDKKLPPNTSLVCMYETVTIPAQTIKMVKIKTSFKEGQAEGFLERQFGSDKEIEDFFAITDSLISCNNPKVQISNFSNFPIKLQKGRILGYMHDPVGYLTQEKELVKEEFVKVEAHAQLIKAIAQIKGKDKLSPEDELLSQSVEGGPKTSEVPDYEHVPSERLLQEMHFAEELSQPDRKKLEKVVMSNHLSFGLDGRLGSHPAKVEINLRPDTKEISLAPYGASPAKREVIDKQIDDWLRLEVIEPSKSPWGFPVIVVYRNNKPRVCIDYRRLNEVAIPDEYPLPRQTDILDALRNKNIYSTLDALAGFTQLSIKEEDKPKTAFRCHRGLFQFKRLPFGFRNGPAVFQRVMTNVLAPFLWTFALVYIDDIVIFSKNVDDHCGHLHEVLQAIHKSGITLSPSKCFIGYESLLLLGQKVSRLGLSTHKEKVDAIVQLEPPRNIPTLQTFLGMMTYFASYVPFYAWIVAPLFALLRKGKTWNWTKLEQDTFELAKQALISAPVIAYPLPERPYRLYTDACDYGLAAILQQVQPIKVKDLRGTKIYDCLKKAFDNGEQVPRLTIPASKQRDDLIGGIPGIRTVLRKLQFKLSESLHTGQEF